VLLDDIVSAAVKQIKRQLSLILSAFYSEIYIVKQIEPNRFTHIKNPVTHYIWRYFMKDEKQVISMALWALSKSANLTYS
jgi:hypothetical protein